MLIDPEYGIHASRPQPESELILAILGRAVLDLFGSVALVASPEEAAQVRWDALLFLTREKGPWARRRTDLCDAVGIDGDEMRTRVVAVLDGNVKALDVYDGRNHLTHLDTARELWAREKAPKPGKPPKPRKPAAARQPTAQVSKYADVRAAILPLLDQPKKFKDLLLATGGDLSDTVMRKVLKNAIAKGEIVQDPKTWEYSRAAPETAVAAEAA